MKSAPTGGRLICFCGIDGSGKTTHLNFAARALRQLGVRTRIVKPISTQSPFFRTIEPLTPQMDLQNYCNIFAFERFKAIRERIVPMLGKHEVVLSDRYLFTDWAYTIGYGKDPTFAKMLIEKAPRPDLTLIFDLPAELALSRISSRVKAWRPQENLKVLTSAGQAYKVIAKEIEAVTIDATCAPGITQESVLRSIGQLLDLEIGTFDGQRTPASKSSR